MESRTKFNAQDRSPKLATDGSRWHSDALGCVSTVGLAIGWVRHRQDGRWHSDALGCVSTVGLAIGWVRHRQDGRLTSP
jgi:hypothetical protein